MSFLQRPRSPFQISAFLEESPFLRICSIQTSESGLYQTPFLIPPSRSLSGLMKYLLRTWRCLDSRISPSALNNFPRNLETFSSLFFGPFFSIRYYVWLFFRLIPFPLSSEEIGFSKNVSPMDFFDPILRQLALFIMGILVMGEGEILPPLDLSGFFRFCAESLLHPFLRSFFPFCNFSPKVLGLFSEHCLEDFYFSPSTSIDSFSY